MISEGQIVEGRVTTITSFGAFVKFDSGETGMIHISEIAEDYVRDIRDYLQEGQIVRCKSLGPGKDGKLSLSIKRLNSDGKKNSGRFSEGNKPSQQENKDMSFEERLSKFLKDSDEKLLDLRRKMDGKRGGGYGRRSSIKM